MRAAQAADPDISTDLTEGAVHRLDLGEQAVSIRPFPTLFPEFSPQRLHARGFSATALLLRMTREEIGSYLGLKLETVSRTFSKFQDEGILEVKQRDIRILDHDALKRLVNSTNC
jgi:CRP-like cAMP-binding protein